MTPPPENSRKPRANARTLQDARASVRVTKPEPLHYGSETHAASTARRPGAARAAGGT
jgi:hypothetical protein